VLPGIRRAFELPSASAAPIPAGDAQLQVRQDTGTVQVFDVKIAQ
jgi:hypothetical protein